MGGICGFIGKKCFGENELMHMCSEISYRGTENEYGHAFFQLNHEIYAGLACQRLAIKDLETGFPLPISSSDNRVSVVLDGEIYNYQEIREQIADYPFRTHCDTEVIVAAYLKWGIGFVKKLNGMFAIALLDRKENVLFLVRDWMGEKPLYYYVNDEKDVLFASQMKSFFKLECFQKEIRTEVLGSYFLHACIEAPNTIYKNVYKLEHGSVLKICNGKLSVKKYWDIAKRHQELSRYEVKDYEEAKQGSEERIKKSIQIRMAEKQEIGFCLSGGYDSALVCAIAQSISKVPIRTYTIGVHDKAINEAVYAKQIAKQLGTNHTELYIDEKQMLSLVEEIPNYFDEPFADSSQLPTMLLSSLAKKDVSMILTGIGGDELFGGLDIYEIVREAQQRKYIGRLLYALRQIPFLAQAKLWTKLPLIYRIISDDINHEAQTQLGVNSYIKCINDILITEPKTFYYEMESRYKESDWGVRRMLLDLDTFTIDDELTKQDRGAMRYGLESRSPFYDKNLVEYAFRIPIEFKLDKTKRKKILKDLVHQYIPQELMDRKKMGFCIPQDRWLRGPLKEQAMDYVSPDFLKKQGIFDAEKTYQFVKTYMEKGDREKWSGQNFSKVVWAYFIFQQWYQFYH